MRQSVKKWCCVKNSLGCIFETWLKFTPRWGQTKGTIDERVVWSRASCENNFSFRMTFVHSCGHSNLRICEYIRVQWSLPREDSAWRAFFRNDSTNSSHDSEYSDWSTGLMVNVSIEIAYVDTPLARIICINTNEMKETHGFDRMDLNVYLKYNPQDWLPSRFNNWKVLIITHFYRTRLRDSAVLSKNENAIGDMKDIIKNTWRRKKKKCRMFETTTARMTHWSGASLRSSIECLLV